LCYCQAAILRHCDISTGYGQQRREHFLLFSPSSLFRNALCACFALSLFDTCAVYRQNTIIDLAMFCPNGCSVFYACTYVCLFAESLLCGDTFCEHDMTCVGRLAVCILGVCIQSVVCVSGTTGLFKLNYTAGICAVALLQ
jgi:hypothetical protein